MKREKILGLGEVSKVGITNFTKLVKEMERQLGKVEVYLLYRGRD